MNVRDKSNKNGKSLGIIKKNTVVEVIEILSNDWYKIVYPKAAQGFAFVSNRTGKYFNYTEIKKEDK